MKAYMVAECVGDSIYEAHTLPFVYLKREWAELQMSILNENREYGIHYKIREITIVEPPKK